MLTDTGFAYDKQENSKHASNPQAHAHADAAQQNTSNGLRLPPPTIKEEHAAQSNANKQQQTKQTSLTKVTTRPAVFSIVKRMSEVRPTMLVAVSAATTAMLGVMATLSRFPTTTTTTK